MLFSWGIGCGTTYAANAPPTLSLIAPLPDATFSAPASIVLTATAGDSDGTVANVKFFQGTTLLKQVAKAPYTFTWNNVGVGVYSLTAKVTDNRGASTVSTAVSITVTNTPPMISLTEPVTGATFSPSATIMLRATAVDSDGTIANVKFFQGTTLLKQVAKAPYSFVWKTVPVGTYSVTVRATDNMGAVTTSAAVFITVAPPNINSPPIVSLTSPAAGQVLTAPASIPLAATASDSDGTVAQVEFFQGSTRLGQSNSAPYNVLWTDALAGDYILTARATDNAGAITTSTAVSISVRPPTPNIPPFVSLTAPADAASFPAPATITLAATASDLDGSIAKVEFFQGSTLLGEAVNAPYGFTWINAPAGRYSLTARAADNLGVGTTSAAVSITVSTRTSAGPVNYVYDRLSRLIAVIEPVGETAVYKYDPVGNLLSITRHSTASLAILDFSPRSSPVGAMVTISGTGFSSTLSENTVTFNGIPATVISNSFLKLVVKAPLDATTGPIQVVTPTGSATSAKPFTVTP